MKAFLTHLNLYVQDEPEPVNGEGAVRVHIELHGSIKFTTTATSKSENALKQHIGNTLRDKIFQLLSEIDLDEEETA